MITRAQLHLTQLAVTTIKSRLLKMHKSYWLIPIFLIVTACAGLSEPYRFGALRAELPPESLGREIGLSQLLIGQHGDQTVKLRMEVDVNRDRLVVIGLTPLGIKLFTLEQNGNAEDLIATAHTDQFALNTDYLLFDLYITYWPLSVLEDALSSIEMEIEADFEDNTRIVKGMNGEKIARVHYSRYLKDSVVDAENITITRFDVPYEIRVTTLQ